MEKKKTVILLHGFGEDHKVFKSQLDMLSAFYDVFAPDLPGSGALSKAAIPMENASINLLAEWVNSFLMDRGIESCIMFGHSMGGYVTLAFAEKFPEKLEAIGLIHSTAYADSEEKKNTREKAIVFIKEKGGYLFLKTAIPNLFGAVFKQQSPQKVQMLLEESRRFKDDWLVWYYRAMINRPDRSNVLKQAKVQVLIVAGDEDMAAPVTDLSAQAALPEICHFHLLKETGHMGMLEREAAMNEILLNFMSTI
jgi:pimeloyl-ACP methyl ester carboxylesterase